MKCLVLFLLPLTAFANSTEEYTQACQSSFERIITKRQPDKAEDARQLGLEFCPDMAKHMVSDGNVKLNACMDVIYHLSNGAPLADRKQMAAVYCF